jgi:hypothetical protein
MTVATLEIRIKKLQAQIAVLKAGYNPNESRDHGKWSGGGGGGGGGRKIKITSGTHPLLHSVVLDMMLNNDAHQLSVPTHYNVEGYSANQLSAMETTIKSLSSSDRALLGSGETYKIRRAELRNPALKSISNLLTQVFNQPKLKSKAGTTSESAKADMARLRAKYNIPE